MIEHNVPPFVEITLKEFVKLSPLVTGGRILDVQLNEKNQMFLQNNAVNHWVFPVLANWRGLNG